MPNHIRRAMTPELPKFTEKAVAKIEEKAREKLRKLVKKDPDAYSGTEKSALKKIDSWHFYPTHDNAWRSGEEHKDLVVDTGLGIETVITVRNAFAPAEDGVVHWSDVKSGIAALNLYAPNGF